MRRLLTLLLLVVVTGSGQAAELKPGAHAVASAHPLATDAGLEILQAGGNAFDAAVAVSAAIAVVEPTGSGIGGGAFWLLHRASDGLETFVDGRETAPAAASASMYQNAQGQVIEKLSRDGALAAAIPGEPAGLEYLAKRYGRLPLKRSLAPAIRYARDGFACDDKLAAAFRQHWSRLSPVARSVFGPQPPTSGTLLRQPDLARTLQAIADRGSAGFYQGEVAQRLVQGVRQAGGNWTLDDLGRYRIIERKPVELYYRDLRIVTAPPPSAGGVTLGQVFNQLEVLGHRSQGVEGKHLVIEAMRRAYRDRAAYLGDPDFVHIPLFQLLSRSYAIEMARSISRERATLSSTLPPSRPYWEGSDTTHFSIIDAEGNRVAATLSINLPFGSGFMPAGTGVFLNDEMDDFAASVTASNAYGLVGSVPNLVAPGKRPLSSMSPTFVEGPRGLLVLGTPGGSRIITMVLLGILGWNDGLDTHQVVRLPRYHHQYLPDEVQHEPGAFLPEEQARLSGMGHKLRVLGSPYGNMQAVAWNPGSGALEAAADPRGVGAGRVMPAGPVTTAP